MSIYTDKGFKNRDHYLEELAGDLEVDVNIVHMLADLLGPNEDFDGLVTAIEDIAGGCY